MTIQSLYPVLDKIDLEKRTDIMFFISNNIELLLMSHSIEDLRDFIKRLSLVSNNSGLQIVSLLIYPEDEIPQILKRLEQEILDNLTAT